MTSYTSTIDDQQERHYIGNLLYDDDPFSPPSSSQFEPNSAQQLSVGNVLSGGGPIGPSPNPTFWPEPPPPYSPYSVRPLQWCSVNRQPADLYSTQLHNTFNQIPAFYSPLLYNRHRDWDGFGSSSLDGYPLVGTNVSYGPHAAFTHHLSGRYVTPDAFRHRNGCFAGPYSSFSSTEALQLDPTSHLTSGEYFRNEGVIMHPENLDVLPSVPPTLIDASTCLPLAGKSYRDAASEKKRTSSSASAASALSNLSASGDVKTFRRGSQDLPCKSSKSNTVSTTKNISSGPKKAEGASGKTSLAPNGIKKGKSAAFCSCNENEFQKITRKKTKGVKNNKGEQVVAGEEGLGINQAVDASSRFDVLQLLSNQVNINSSCTPSAATVGLHKSHGSTKVIKTEKVVNEHSIKIDTLRRNKRQKEASAIDAAGKTRDTIGLSTTVSELLQRAASKKNVFGLHRDSGERNVFETPRFASRKQRGGIRKRNTATLDYLNCFFMAILLFVKGAAEWIADLIIDIFFQSRDVVVYGASKSYQSFVYCCSHSWYLILAHIKLLWKNVCGFKAYILEHSFTKRPVEVVAWGLDDNINLPLTGDEVLNRLLLCRGQDAYAILGLRASCSDEEVKHYYKKQAFLVHPDKNLIEGAAEGFRFLSKAFEAISTPELRNSYNLLRLNSPVHKELEQLWRRLHDKIKETKNSLPCDCGKRHARIAMKNISPQQARYCKRCNLRHPAKHNDIWAESAFLGLWWTYYACLDGVVYNVSEWATCPKNNLKNLKANAHGIQYCMVSYACGTSTKRDASLKHARKGQMSRCGTDECDFTNEGYPYELDDDFAYVASHGFKDISTPSQLAPCRSFDRRLFNHDRPRRAGRRKKLH